MLRRGEMIKGALRPAEECRLRVESRLREAGDARVAAADARQTQAVVDLGDPSTAPAGPRRFDPATEEELYENLRRADERGAEERRWQERKERQPLGVPGGAEARRRRGDGARSEKRAAGN